MPWFESNAQLILMTAASVSFTSSADCAVVIPAFNPERPILRTAVAYFLDHELDLVREIIVIDDGSEPPITREDLLGARLEEPAAVRVRLERQPNRGVGAARNAAVRLTAAPFTVFLDSDCLPQTGWVGTLTAPLRSGEAVLACGTTLTYDLKPFVSEYADFMGYLREPVRHRGKIANAVQANFAMRRDVYLEINGFEEQLRRVQDLDFTWRLIQAGYQEKLVYVREAVLLHKHRDTLRKFLKQGYQSGQGGMAHCLLRGRNPREVFVLRPSLGGVMFQLAAMAVKTSHTFRRAVQRYRFNYRTVAFPLLTLARMVVYNWGSYTLYRRYRRSGKLSFELQA